MSATLVTRTTLRKLTAYAFAAALSVLTAIAQVNADVVFANPINDSGNPSTSNPYTAGQTFDPNITVSGIGRGSGINSNAATNRYNARDWSFASLDTNDYFTFTLTPNTGYEIDFSNLAGVWRRSGTGPNTYAFRSSLDGFSADISTGAITGNASDVSYDIDLSAIQNITTSIEFRLFGWGGNNAAGTFSFNDFTFNGRVSQSTVAGPNINPATTAVNFANRIVNTAASQAVTLNEVGNEPANYTSSVSGDATVTAGDSGSIGALGTGSITVGMNVASAGLKSGTVTIDDGNADVDSIAVSGSVFDSSSARFLSDGSATLSLDFGTFAQGSGVQFLNESIENALQTAGFTAGLDLDSINGSGDTGILSTDLASGQFTDLAAGSSHAFQALFDTSTEGVFSASFIVGLSDADSYEGAGATGSQLLTLNLTGTVGSTPGILAGDYNGDEIVNAADYALWRDNLGAAPDTLPNDVDGGNIGQPQYNTWYANFGATPPIGVGASAAVPEPASVWLSIGTAISLGFCLRTHKRR